MQHFDLLASPLEGTNLIEASAGTGKTYTIAALYLRLIVEKILTPEQILVVTFTEAATKELRDRIRRKLRDAVDAFSGVEVADDFLTQLASTTADRKGVLGRLTEALRAFDLSAIFTIHGFCQRVLYENAFESGSLFDTELVTTQDDLKREIVEDFWRTHFYRAPPQVVRYALSNGYSPETFFKLVEKPGVCRPDLKVVPQCAPPSPTLLKKSVEQLSVAVQRLEKLWPSGKGDVVQLLRSADLRANSLYRCCDPKGAECTSDRDAKIDELVREMEGFLRGKDPAFPYPLSRQFEAFTHSKLQSCTKKGCTFPSNDIITLCDKIFQLAEDVREHMERYFLYIKGEALRYVSAELPARKQRQNIHHFDDLLLRLKQGLDRADGVELAAAVRGAYRAALIDEFQDTDPIQYGIFHSIFSGENRCLFLIGDPKQAIYSFRGADIFTYMKAAGNADRIYTLDTNWRSDSELISALNALFSSSDNPFVYPEISFQPVQASSEKKSEPLTFHGRQQAPLELWYLGSDGLSEGTKPINKKEAQTLIRRSIAAEVARLLQLGASGKALIGGRAVREGDLAVLVRTNLEAHEVKVALSAVNIPSVLHSTEDVFDAPEAEELQRVLTAVAEPNREGLLRAALATDMLGVSGEDLARWMQEETSWEEWVMKFRGYLDLWSVHGFMRMFSRFMVEQRVRSRLLSLPNGERRITNLLHLSELLHQQAVEDSLGVTELLKWLAQQRDPEFRGTMEHQLRLETDENAVKLVTIHKSKGLEYPIVFCPFTWGSSRIANGSTPFMFHDESDGRRVTLDLGSRERDAHRRYAEKELLAENMRLLYVALTRAQKRCYLVWGRFNTAETSAPAYLFHHRGASYSDDVVTETAKTYKALKDVDIWDRLESIAERGRGSIRLIRMDQPGEVTYTPHKIQSKDLLCRVFSGKIEREWKISSYSALTLNLAHAAELPDRDESDEPLPAAEEAERTSLAEKPPDIFSFPRGTKAGTLLHDILENLDFTAREPDVLEGLVGRKLHDYGYERKWLETVCNMVRRVLAVPLGQGNETFTLADIPNEERLNELEFYFPLERLTSEKLQCVFAAHGGSGTVTESATGMERLTIAGTPAADTLVLPENKGIWPEQLSHLSFQPVRGFLKGFIDVVFRFRERFYLVDWKSNHLGNRAEDYGPRELKTVMQREFYILQYHLYAVALHRYLSTRLADYRYDSHFGGVLYIFLRGVDPIAGTQYGIFFDRPRLDLIRDLSAVLGGDATK